MNAGGTIPHRLCADGDTSYLDAHHAPGLRLVLAHSPHLASRSRDHRRRKKEHFMQSSAVIACAAYSHLCPFRVCRSP